jgi:hypothetical protein
MQSTPTDAKPSPLFFNSARGSRQSPFGRPGSIRQGSPSTARPSTPTSSPLKSSTPSAPSPAPLRQGTVSPSQNAPPWLKTAGTANAGVRPRSCGHRLDFRSRPRENCGRPRGSRCLLDLNYCRQRANDLRSTTHARTLALPMQQYDPSAQHPSLRGLMEEENDQPHRHSSRETAPHQSSRRQSR